MIAIAGSGGLIGRALLAAFEQTHPDAVLGLARPSFDLTAPSTWSRLPAGCRCVVIAAGLADGSRDDLMAVNDLATGNFASYCRDRGAQKLILLSSGAVYGNAPARTFPGMPEKPASDYGISRLAGERRVSDAWQGAALATLRLYFPYGRGQKSPRLIPRMVERLRQRLPITCRPDGGPVLSLTHVDDIVDIIVRDFVLGDGAGTYNIASPCTMPIEEIAIALAAGLGVSPTISRDGAGCDCVSEPYPRSDWREFRAREVL